MTVPPETESTGAELSSELIITLVNEAPIAVAAFDRNLCYLAVSKGWLRHFGCDRQHVLGRPHAQAFPTQAGAWCDALHKAAQGKAVSGVERVQQQPQGSDGWLTWKVWPVESQDGLMFASLTPFLDADAGMPTLHLGSDSVREIVSALGIGVLEHDFTTGKTVISDSYLDLLGLNRKQIPKTDDDWIALLRPMDLNIFYQIRKHAFDPKYDGKLSFDIAPIVAGVERCMSIQLRILFTGTGPKRRPHHLIGVLVDRTEESRMHEALVHAQRLEAVGRIAGMVAHDFNNILSVILGNLELVEPKLSDDGARALLHNAIEATQIGAGFNRRLLTLAGGHGGKPVCFHLDNHLSQTCELYCRVLRDDVVLRFEPCSDNAHVFLDPVDLDAAMLNLVVNAHDVLPNGGQIVISTRRATAAEARAEFEDALSNQGYVQITVSDDGPGMSQEVAARVGEPFFTTKPRGIGFGLGLASVISSVQHALGTFHIDTGPDMGTRANIFLPVMDGAEEDAHLKDPEIPMGAGEVILVVEDDPMVREAAIQRLQALGYSVREAPNAQAALTVIEAEKPVDLVFSDIVMPGGMSGLDLAKKLAADHPQIRVLLTTGHASADFLGRHELDEAPDVLPKPHTLWDLAHAIRRTLDRP